MNVRRRDILYGSGAWASGLGARGRGVALAPAAQVGRPAPVSTKKIRLAVVGGGFGTQFSFHEHPNCTVAAVADLREDRRRALSQTFRCDNVYPSLEKLLEAERGLDAIAIFTGAPDHYRHVEASMRRGLHVYCAVPAVFTLEEAAKLKALKENTGLRYMMGETSYYRPGCIHARTLLASGALGEIFYSELNYYHDRGDLDKLVADKTSRFYEPGGARSWRWGLPPLHYPTHCLGFIVGVTGERIRTVSALGWGTSHPWLDENAYGNRFWNESALMQTDKGHMVRCNVFWLVGEDGERAQWYGSNGTLYMANNGLHGDLFRARNQGAKPVKYPDYLNDPMIPPPMRHASGHGGSYVFLSAEFINALIEDREPAVDVYKALAMTVPGIVGHESARKGGERLTVPAFDRV
ncbi:MAG: Gfo/Idh/MocA family oxidoreductase [Acidobacteria bacterium]|nr:Gfo/Idh/MocA family oxidoreductase [Acidobacteriota bacterium]